MTSLPCSAVSTSEAILVGVTAVALGAGSVLQLDGSLAVWASLLVFGSVLVGAQRFDASAARPLAGFALLSGVFVGLAPGGTWPLPPLLALAIILVAPACSSSTAASVSRTRRNAQPSTAWPADGAVTCSASCGHTSPEREPGAPRIAGR